MKIASLLAAAVLLGLAHTAASAQSTARTFVLPHVLERPGRVGTSPNNLDFEIHFLSFGRTPVELYLFDSGTGQPLKSRTGADVCNPCTIEFSRGPKQVLSIEERVLAAGGFARPLVSAYATLNTRGSRSLEGVAVQAFVINAGPGPSDLSVFGFEPQPIAAEAQ